MCIEIDSTYKKYPFVAIFYFGKTASGGWNNSVEQPALSFEYAMACIEPWEKWQIARTSDGLVIFEGLVK